MIRFDAVTKQFPDGTTAVDDLSLTAPTGKITVLVGPSGCGKTTSLRMVNRMIEPTRGTISLDGQDTGRMKQAELRRGIGYVIQHAGLFPHRTVIDNIGTVPRLLGWDKKQIKERSRDLLERVGLESHLADRYPSQLSGGQKQRVGIARALATNPKILLADESTSALDPETTGDVLELLDRVNKELGITVVVITHEMEVVKQICDRVAVMELGKVVELGEVYQVFSHPQHRATRRFVATAIKDKPDAKVLERLRARHPEHLITVFVHEDGGYGKRITDVLQEHNVRGGIIYGGISEVKLRPFGSLTWGLEGLQSDIANAVRELSSYTHVVDLGTTARPLDGFGYGADAIALAAERAQESAELEASGARKGLGKLFGGNR